MLPFSTITKPSQVLSFSMSVYKDGCGAVLEHVHLPALARTTKPRRLSPSGWFTRRSLKAICLCRAQRLLLRSAVMTDDRAGVNGLFAMNAGVVS